MMRKPSTPAEQSHRTARIVAVVAATIISLSCGTNYGFSAWGPQFAERLGLTATETELIGSFGNIGMYAMGIPGGILIDTRGPRWGVLLGSICLACGYFPLKSAYDKGPGATSLPALCFFGLLTGTGSCTAFTGAIKACATNWPQHRGTATAFPLSAFGLSAFFYTTLASLVFPDDTSGYLLLLATGTTLMTFVSMFFLSMIPPPQGAYESLPTSDPSSRPGLKRHDSNRMHRRSPSVHNHPPPLGRSSETSSLVSSTSTLSSGPGDLLPDEIPPHHRSRTVSPHRQHHSSPTPRPDITGLAVIRTGKFWQLFVMLSLLAGTGIMTINNIGNDARSLWHAFDPSASHDFIQQRQLMHVSVLSLCSFFGRLASGIGSDALVRRRRSRFWTLVASAAVFVLAQVCALNIGNPNSLFWLSGLTGVAYGMLFGVFPALVADAFGPSGMGINWNCMTWAPIVSGSGFNLIYGAILDERSTVRPIPGGEGKELVCDLGKACYSGAYWITLAAAVAAVGWGLFCIRQEGAELVKEREEREHAP